MRGLSSALHAAFSEPVDAQDMTTVKTWLASAALLGGAGGGAAAGLMATGPEQAPAAAQSPTSASPDAGQLQQQIDALLQEDQALKRAVGRAHARLALQVHNSQRSLAALQHRIAAAQAELAAAQASRQQVQTVITAAPPATAPAQHTTTGASGAGGHGEGGEHEGGGDD